MDDIRARQLVERYADSLLRLACAWLGNVEDARDVCQNTFLKALLHDRSFPDPEQEKAWLLRVAINACKNHRKSACLPAGVNRGASDGSNKGLIGVLL